MTTSSTLEATLESDPDDEDAYLVYADWLQARGDPRGELASIDRELAADARGERGCLLRARRRELFARHRNELFGDLAGLVVPGLRLVWQHGFVRAAEIRAWPDSGDAASTPPAVLRALFDAPSCAFLRSLTLAPQASSGPGGQDHGPAGRPSFELLTSELARAPRPTLRELALTGLQHDSERTSRASDRRMPVWPKIGDLADVLAAAPRLRALTLCGVDVHLPPLSYPHLRVLRLQPMRLVRALLRDLQHAGLPALDTLELWLGRCQLDAGAVCDDLASLPASVRHLGLRNAAHADDLVAHLVRGPLIERLETLDLSMGTLGDEGAMQIARAMRRMKRLERLDVSDCYVSSKGRRRLARIDAVQIGYQEEDSDDGERVPLFPDRFRYGRPWIERRRAAQQSARGGHAGSARVIYRSALAIARIIASSTAERDILRWLYHALYSTSRLAEAEEVLRDLIALDAPAVHGDEIPATEASVLLARLRSSRGDYHHAAAILGEVLDQAEKGESAVSEAEVAIELAHAWLGLGRFGDALGLLERWVGGPRESADLHNLLGIARQNLGQLDQAEAAFRRCLELHDLDWNKAPALQSLTGVLWRGERYDEALSLCHEALELAQSSGNRVSEGRVEAQLGNYLLLRGRAPEAEPHLVAAIAIHRETGDRAGLALSLSQLASLCRQLGRHDDAEQHGKAALAASREIGNRQWEGNCLGELASTALDRDDLDKAEDLARQALALHDEMGDQHGRETRYTVLGLIALHRGDLATALEEYGRARAIADELRDRCWQAYVDSRMGLVHLVAGRRADASTLYERALAVMEEIADQQILGRILVLRSALAVVTGDLAAADADFARARELASRAGDAQALTELLCCEHMAASVRGQPSRAPGGAAARRFLSLLERAQRSR